MDSYSSPENLESRRCRSKEAQSGNEASKKRKQELFENEKRVVRVKVEAVTNGEGDADHQKQKHKSELGSPPPPPDSWSWRKYGQKPIKGSPYPWGYYRCTTGKGCLAKKEVERCKEDASVFIITYTSPHNHNRISHAGPMANSSTQKHRPQSPDKRTHSSNNTHTCVEHQHSSSNAMPMAKQEAQEPEPYVVSLDGITPLPLPLSHHDQHHPFASYDLKSHPASSRKLEDQNNDFFDDLELDL